MSDINNILGFEISKSDVLDLIFYCPFDLA